MSLTRQFLREFRPLFRMLEEPFGRPAPFGGSYSRVGQRGSPFNLISEPWLGAGALNANVPAIDVSEEPDAFVVEAELPGVKKENIDLKIGDDGQSVTIEGRTHFQSKTPPTQEGESSAQTQSTAEGTQTSDSKAVTQTNNNSTQLSTERTLTGSSSFSRTIWLPRRVDPSNVNAKLEDGVLTVRISKTEDRESVKVNIQ